jgi:hypothetical protein
MKSKIADFIIQKSQKLQKIWKWDQTQKNWGTNVIDDIFFVGGHLELASWSFGSGELVILALGLSVHRPSHFRGWVDGWFDHAMLQNHDNKYSVYFARKYDLFTWIIKLAKKIFRIHFETWRSVLRIFSWRTRVLDRSCSFCSCLYRRLLWKSTSHCCGHFLSTNEKHNKHSHFGKPTFEISIVI